MPECTSISSIVVKAKAKELGFHEVGITAVGDLDPTETEKLPAWLKMGYHADMEWMENPQRQQISLIMPDVRSLISVALNYYTPHERPHGNEYGKISRYAWGRDYHRIIHKKLKALAI